MYLFKETNSRKENPSLRIFVPKYQDTKLSFIFNGCFEASSVHKKALRNECLSYFGGFYNKNDQGYYFLFHSDKIHFLRQIDGRLRKMESLQCQVRHFL